MRRAGIDDVLENGTPAWIIHTDPSAQQVARYAAAGAEFIHMDASMEECLERAKDRPEGTAEAIRDYFAAREEKGVPAMETKSIDLLVKEAPGDVPGIIAYASTFDRIPDAYGDVVAKGAFAGTLKRLKESGNNLPLLYGHVMDQPENIIGTVVKAEEDEHGLLVEAVFDMENPKAQTVHRAVLSKAITKLSFAFSVIDDRTITLEDYGEVRELTELEIYEVSLVVVPANPRAQVVAAKDAEPELKTSEETPAVDTAEPETSEVKAEEPMEAKAEEPDGVEAEAEPETINTVSEKEKPMEIETMNAIAEAQPAEKGLADNLREVVALLPKGEKFSRSIEMKAAAPMLAPQYIYTQSRNVASATGRLGVADLLGYEAIEGGAYTFVSLTDKTDAFAAVAEGGAKPLNDYTETMVTVPLTKVAGVLKESMELIEDADFVAQASENRGVFKLQRKIEDQILNGNGTSPNMTGILATSGIGTITTGISEANLLNAIEKVMTDSGYAADGIIMNPADYASRVSATLSAKRSLFGTDYNTFMGLPIVKSDLIASGTAIVGNFKQAATLVGKGGVRVEIANQNEDDFIKNLFAVRIEQRCALAVRVPAAFVKVYTA